MIGAASGVVLTLISDVTNFAITGMALEKATGSHDRSWLEIGLSTAGSAAIGAIFGHFTKGLKVNGFTAGRGSYLHVFKTQTTNLLRHGYTMSMKTTGKGIVSAIISSQVMGNVFKGTLRGTQQWYEYLSTGDTEGLNLFYIFAYEMLKRRGMPNLLPRF